MRHITDMRSVIAAIAVLALMASGAQADFGTAGWGIFKRVQSAQFGGIASAAPVNGSVTGMLYNPAALGRTQSREVAFISEQGIDEDRFGSIIYTHPAGTSVFGVAAAYYDAGTAELNWVDGSGLHTEDVSAQKDMLGVVSFAHRPSSRLSLGISLKAASSELAEQYSAYAYAADAGMMYLPANNLALSLAVQNVGTSSAFIEKANPLPTGVYAGCGYQARTGAVTISPAAGVTYLVEDEQTVPEAGVEIGYGTIAINAGYRSYTGESTLHVGFELALQNLSFGYAFLPGNRLDTVHRLSMGYRFNAVKGLK